MKVLLKEDVDNLGYAGQVMKVADGYGRNYLLPRGLAVKATPNVLKAADAWRQRATVRVAELRQEHEVLAERIRGARLTFAAKAGESGKLYGSITHSDIADQLNAALGTTIDRHNIVGEPLRQLGEHPVTIRLSKDYQPQVVVEVVAEGARPHKAPAEAAPVAEAAAEPAPADSESLAEAAEAVEPAVAESEPEAEVAEEIEEMEEAAA